MSGVTQAIRRWFRVENVPVTLIAPPVAGTRIHSRGSGRIGTVVRTLDDGIRSVIEWDGGDYGNHKVWVDRGEEAMFTAIPTTDAERAEWLYKAQQQEAERDAVERTEAEAFREDFGTDDEVSETDCIEGDPWTDRYEAAEQFAVGDRVKAYGKEGVLVDKSSVDLYVKMDEEWGFDMDTQVSPLAVETHERRTSRESGERGL